MPHHLALFRFPVPLYGFQLLAEHPVPDLRAGRFREARFLQFRRLGRVPGPGESSLHSHRAPTGLTQGEHGDRRDIQQSVGAAVYDTREETAREGERRRCQLDMVL